MKLSDQAMTAIMGALQKCIQGQSDIVPILKDFDFEKSPEASRWGGNAELIVRNHPSFSMEVPEEAVEAWN